MRAVRMKSALKLRLWAVLLPFFEACVSYAAPSSTSFRGGGSSSATRLAAELEHESSARLSKALSKRILEQKPVLDALSPSRSASEPRLLSSAVSNGGDHADTNRLLSTKSEACDSAFVNQCLGNEGCIACFIELETNDVDWASVSKDTPCNDVVGFLQKGGYCKGLGSSQTNVNAFCSTFSVCVVWGRGEGIDDDRQGGNHNYDEPDGGGSSVNCGKLTECKWDGMRPGYVGNGICNTEECYNTAICNYDGGDCCRDTCNATSSLVECGHDGYYCLNPASADCDSALTRDCSAKSSNSTKPRPECGSSDSLWAVKMYDSWGDGWDDTNMKITRTSGSTLEVFNGALQSGAQGMEYVCLSKSPTCYRVEVKGGMWGKEVSWEVKPIAEGAPAIAGGGSPMDCNFAVGGADACGTTCTGKPNLDPSKDPEYKQFKDMFNCIQSKCLIQANACNQDSVCKKCFQDDPHDYCFGNDVFNALIDCAICKCSDASKSSEFCANKGKDFSPASGGGGGGGGSGTGAKKACTPAETVSGGNAVISFSKCLDFEQVTMLIPDYDTNNFGPLDKFEACAHSYSTADHGGHTALGCLQILVNAMSGTGFQEDSEAPKDAVMALAKSLYQQPESFCNCTLSASDKCPFCQSFVNFKTLLYESLDACQALDEIDCDAWSEFSTPCKANLEAQYTTIDFSKAEQCDYVRNGCGGAGPFPAFRRLDCDAEVSAAAWSFYTTFADKCVKGSSSKPQPPGPRPAPVPVPAPSSPGTRPSKPYVPPDENDGKSPSDSGKPYVPPEEDNKKSYSPPSEKKSGRRWFWSLFWICAIGGGAYYVYKRRSDGFSFIRYRRMRNAIPSFGYGYGGGGDSDMYMGLSLESSTTFEPPSLPPTPAAMGAMGYQ